MRGAGADEMYSWRSLRLQNVCIAMSSGERRGKETKRPKERETACQYQGTTPRKTMKLMLLQSIATEAKPTRPKAQNQKGVFCNAGTLHMRKKRGPCIIQRKRQLWHSSESGTGELLEVKIQFPQVTHSVQRRMPLLSNNIKQSCNSILCILSNWSTGQYYIVYWKIRDIHFIQWV